MKAFVQGKWQGDFLDYHRPPEHYRIAVESCLAASPVADLYFVRPFDLRMLRNYISDIGLAAVLKKALSRWRESCRNEKWVSLGTGTVIEAPSVARLEEGQRVFFLAPCHPACAERLTLPEDLLKPCSEDVARSHTPGKIQFAIEPRFSALANEVITQCGARVAGWSSDSGEQLCRTRCREVLDSVEDHIRSFDWSQARALPRSSDQSTRTKIEHVLKSRGRRRRKSASLFGYGQYAKTMCLPNVSEHIDIVHFHEIDPMQVPRQRMHHGNWSTSPVPEPTENVDVFFVAGFHHTHAPLAVEALRRGIHAVVEKPITVDGIQLAELVAAMRASPAHIYPCFQKRFSPFNALALQDLQVSPGDPVSYHCIVYEVPLPGRHWYRWPNSRSRLVSNGCHWTDHFLHLNAFSPVVSSQVQEFANGTLSCAVELENSACFTMTLTEIGSDRIGMQDYVELRLGSRTAKITNNSRYEFESKSRRRIARANKYVSYRDMYREIASRIERGEPGDGVREVEASAGLVIALEDQLRTRCQSKG